MSIDAIRTLLIEDNPGDARLVREALASARWTTFTVESADRLAAGMVRLRRADIDVVLADLSLPDSHGLDTISRLRDAAPYVPIIALSGLDDELLIQDAVKRGAEDYIVKGAFTSDILMRSVRYAIDRKKARDELAQARDSALESARLRAEFLANMSHEIRTPLNGVVGMTRLLVDTELTNEQRELAEIVRSSADTLLHIVNDILDFSKISAGKVTLEETDFDLGTAVESVVQIFGEQAQQKGIELASFIDSDVPVLLRGDPARLCQILTNLIGNAVKFTPQGEVTVRIGGVSETDNGLSLRFTVRDTGIGIPLEGQRHLFQAFSQADGSTTRKYGGTGLGLAISAQLVELMGGMIGVQSEPGGGSTFWFTVPLRKQPVAAQSISEARERLEGVKILVADRSPTSARIVREHVSEWGMRCGIASSAAEALVALKTAVVEGDPYRIALIDMQLPEIDGITLSRTIKVDPKLGNTRLLGTYSLGGRPDEAEMKTVGIKGLLAKPIKQTQLFNLLSILTASAKEEAAVAALPKKRRAVRDIQSHVPEQVRNSLKILLVEDNFVNQQVALRIIERLGYHADTANNGREALEILAQANYDIVLMDCQMPEVDGYTATREIRRKEGSANHTIVIGVTAHALAGDREECLAAGMDDYVAKPIIPEDLAAVLDKWSTPDKSVEPTSRDNGQVSRNETDGTEAATLDTDVLAVLREYRRPSEPDFLRKLIGAFLSDLGVKLAQIKEAMTTGDVVQMRHLAHALKGSCGEMGARRMQALCAKLEMLLRSSSFGISPAILRDLEAEASQLRQALEIEQARDFA